MEDMGNPFTEESSDLLVLDSRNIADAAVADTVQQIEQIGGYMKHMWMRDW